MENTNTRTTGILITTPDLASAEATTRKFAAAIDGQTYLKFKAHAGVLQGNGVVSFSYEGCDTDSEAIEALGMMLALVVESL